MDEPDIAIQKIRIFESRSPLRLGLLKTIGPPSSAGTGEHRVKPVAGLAEDPAGHCQWVMAGWWYGLEVDRI